jgi:hypothetical protein
LVKAKSCLPPSAGALLEVVLEVVVLDVVVLDVFDAGGVVRLAVFVVVVVVEVFVVLLAVPVEEQPAATSNATARPPISVVFFIYLFIFL